MLVAVRIVEKPVHQLWPHNPGLRLEILLLFSMGIHRRCCAHCTGGEPLAAALNPKLPLLVFYFLFVNQLTNISAHPRCPERCIGGDPPAAALTP